ncbi:phosphotransacetylase family protein, partial [Candidatus Bathyarchaeota archaeon]|nr:phosphotransacetylase family protein [Candidatus Bathyarchaeota archaeon]
KELLNLGENVNVISPIQVGPYYLEKLSRMDRETILETIHNSYEILSKEKDVIIVEILRDIFFGSSIGVSTIEISKKLGLKILMVSSTHKDASIDAISAEKEYISEKGASFLGIVMNSVATIDMDRVKRIYLPLLERKGIKTWGIIPEKIEMRSPTGLEIKELLNAEVLACEDRLGDVIVENYLIGAMTPDSALKYFRASPRKAVITGGDRPDICLVALETDTSLLILTGNVRPSPIVVNKASERGVPVLLVPYDTYSTVNMLQETAGKIKYGDEKRIRLAKQLVAEHIDCKGLLKSLEEDWRA